MKNKGQEREGIQVQEYVRLQETFNTIIRSLERIERSDNINRSNAVRRNHEGDLIHSEYESMKEALITQCLCLQLGLTNKKFKNDQVKRDLVEQVNRWKNGLREGHSKKVNDALEIVNEAINGRLNALKYKTSGLPSNHSQAVGNIVLARNNLDEISNRAMRDPTSYYQSNQYGLRMGEQFAGINNRNNSYGNKKNEIEDRIMELQIKISDCKSKLIANKNPNVIRNIQKEIKDCEEEITRYQRQRN